MMEWKVGDDGWDETLEEWESSIVEDSESPRTEAPADQRHRRRRIGMVLVVVMALVVAAGTALKWRANQNASAVKAAVQSVVDQEMWALESGSLGLYESLLDRQASAGWYREQQGRFVQNSRRGNFSAEVTDLVLVQPDLALAEVRVTGPGSQTRHETRAYRQVENTWRQTTGPADQLWLHQVVRETANLRFFYHRNDAELLEPLIPALQELYTQLLDDFNLTPLANKRELQIIMSAQPADTAHADTSRRYELSSLARTPDTDRIQRELGTQLAENVIRQFYKSAGDMAFVLEGIREWEVATWVGATNPEFETRIRQMVKDRPFLPLSTVKPLSPPAYLDKPTATAFAATVIEYLAWRNGRDAVKLLIEGIRRHDTWPRLIEGGLGLSYQDVDHGWWQFVARRYALPDNRSPDQIRADLIWMLELEELASETRDQYLFRSLLDPRAPSEWQTEQLGRFWRSVSNDPTPNPVDIQDWGYMDDGAWITLVRRPVSSAQANQFDRDVWTSLPLRIYRFTNHRWYLTSPATAFTGPPLKTRTRYFEFRYRQPDADLIPSIAPDVDKLYAQVTRDLGIDDSTPEQLWVELLYSPEATELRAGEPNAIRILSPRLFMTPIAQPEEMFQLALGYEVVSKLLARVVNMPGRGPDIGQPVLYGLAMWELEEWGKVPEWLNTQKVGAIQSYLKRDSFPPSAYPPVYPDAAIAEYVAQTYGRHRLADIAKAAGEQEELRDLIPAALGVDIETFEAGLRSYLERTYDMKPKPGLLTEQ